MDPFLSPELRDKVCTPSLSQGYGSGIEPTRNAYYTHRQMAGV